MDSRRKAVRHAILNEGCHLRRIAASKLLFADVWQACVEYVTKYRHPVTLFMAKEIPEDMIITFARPGEIYVTYIQETSDEIRS